jgi:hypothetical protein
MVQTLKMGAADSSETSVITCQTILCHKADGRNPILSRNLINIENIKR